MSDDPSQAVQRECDGRVLTIRLNRPERKNALTAAMYSRILELFAEAAQTRDIRALVITGAGSAFTSGNDLADFMGQPVFTEDSPVLRFLRALVDFPKPLLAAVNGAAVGVGTTMLLHCDLVYAAASARFSLPFVGLGLVPEAGSSLLLPRVAGMQRAAELLLLGEPFDAATAHRVGLVNEVLPDAELLARVRNRTQLLAERPPDAVMASKELLRGPFRAEIHEAIKREGALFASRLHSAEAAEAFAAFFEKRKPDFSRVAAS
jgi:enoyl-CoA hydratase/carnithine racemase